MALILVETSLEDGSFCYWVPQSEQEGKILTATSRKRKGLD